MKSNPKMSSEFAKFLHFARDSMSVAGVKAQIEREKRGSCNEKAALKTLTRTRMERD
jgi:hypothetical protein